MLLQADNVAVSLYFKTSVIVLSSYRLKHKEVVKMAIDIYEAQIIKKAYNLAHFTCDLVVRLRLI